MAQRLLSSGSEESSAQSLDEWSLHRFALENRVDDLRNALEFGNMKCYINCGDHRDNTPLHIATMRGNRKIVKLLLKNDALVDCKNVKHQTPLTEAITYGDQEIVSLLLNALQNQSRELIKEKQDQLRESLSSIEDFTMQMEWKHHNINMEADQLYQTEDCTLSKRGNRIRLDIATDQLKLNWQELKASFIFDGNEADASESLCYMNHDEQQFRWIYHKSVKATREDLTILMGNEVKIEYFSGNTSKVFQREDQRRRVVRGPHIVRCYSMNNFKQRDIARREHLVSLRNPKEAFKKISKKELFQAAKEFSERYFIGSAIDDDCSSSGLSSNETESEIIGISETELEGGSNDEMEGVSNIEMEVESEHGAAGGSNDEVAGGSKYGAAGSSKYGAARGLRDRNASGSKDQTAGGSKNRSKGILEMDSDSRTELASRTESGVKCREVSYPKLISDLKSTITRNCMSELRNRMSEVTLFAKVLQASQPPTCPEDKFVAPMIPSKLPKISWKEYTNSQSGGIGRKKKSNLLNFNFCDAELELVEGHRMTKAQLRTVLSCFNPVSRFQVLSDFLELNIPDLFPYKLYVRSRSCRSFAVKFHNFKSKPALDQSLFEIPGYYAENPSSYPGLGL